MGVRLARNLQKSSYTVRHTEVSDVGRNRLKEETGLDCVDEDEALNDADCIILAVPDRLIGDIAHAIIDRVKPGAAIIALDAAGPYAGKMPDRKDVTYFITHPCHPSIFGKESDPDAQNDHFGGVSAKQAIVCALMQGPEEHYALCEQVARAIYAPVVRAHRCTMENMVVLEPALSETVAATMCLALREATDEAVRRGVPREAAFDFLLGHLNIELAIMFDITPGRLSDGALQAIEEAKPVLFKENWLENVFDMNAIRDSVMAICEPPNKKP